MSQNDFNIANQGFPSFRSDLNSALQALASNSAGTSAPATTYAYMWWYDSTNNVLKMRNADNDAWINFASFNQATDTWSFASVVIDGDLAVDTNTLFVDSTNNRVGVGTSSPAVPLDVNGRIRTDGGTNFLDIYHNGSVAYFETTGGAATPIGFANNGSERMRIDASGNVLVGKTSTSGAVVGLSLEPIGIIKATRSNNISGFFNREDGDGSIVSFAKDDITVGSIGSLAGTHIYIQSAGNRSGLRFDTGAVTPRKNGASSDNTVDMGSATYRFDDVYATNGLIQTSDANEKQQIAELTAAEMDAAKVISKLFKTFKWNDSVAEKGDDARIHTGVIAQEVEAAMADAGLDAGKYAFFISSTWWEADGQTYETAEEAPEGAIERARKGIRYPQLLAFVGAATEQRLASIEARLDALEA